MLSKATELMVQEMIDFFIADNAEEKLLAKAGLSFSALQSEIASSSWVDIDKYVEQKIDRYLSIKKEEIVYALKNCILDE